MISMSVEVGWSILLNTTELEFHEVQSQLKELVKNEVLHCIPCGEMELLKENVTVKEVTFDVYYTLKDMKYLQFALINKEAHTHG